MSTVKKLDIVSEKLENGLEVVLYKNSRLPLISTAIMYHVGSAREEKNKSGFAHLFEHMMFQASENVPEGGFFHIIESLGGDLNGGTWEDGTVYYQTVPKNALETILWLESDRMGYLLPAVTELSLKNEINVVLNEKRQRYDNVAYGYYDDALRSVLFPDNHPYKLDVIGKMEDLVGSKISDVHAFFKKWYGPNNATLVIAGDIDFQETLGLVKKYFSEIPCSQEDILVQKTQDIVLHENHTLFHEDVFAQVPQFSLVWPTIHKKHEDTLALVLLADVLTSNTFSLLGKNLVEEKKLLTDVSARQKSFELAGYFNLQLSGHPESSYDKIIPQVFECFDNFIKENQCEEDILDIYKKNYLDYLYSVLEEGKELAIQLAEYKVFYDDPEYFIQEIEKLKEIQWKDVYAVFKKYIYDKPYVSISFVPKGKTHLAPIQGKKFIPNTKDYSVSFDGLEPQSPIHLQTKRPRPQLTPFELSTEYLSTFHQYESVSGYCVTKNFPPILSYFMHIPVGFSDSSKEIPGLHYLFSEMLVEGTKTLSSIEFDKALSKLGAQLKIKSNQFGTFIYGNCLSEGFSEYIVLLGDLLKNPGLREDSLEKVKKNILTEIEYIRGEAGPLSTLLLQKVLFDENDILNIPYFGSSSTMESYTVQDVREYFEKYFYGKGNISFSVAGDREEHQFKNDLKILSENWKNVLNSPKANIFSEKKILGKPKLYCIDIPQSRQSRISVARFTYPMSSENYFPFCLATDALSGNFTSRLNLLLREEKGYTYGVSGNTSEYPNYSIFSISGFFHDEYTVDALKLLYENIENYSLGLKQEEFQFVVDARIKSTVRSYETNESVVDQISDIPVYNIDPLYQRKQIEYLKRVTFDELNKIVQQEFSQPMVYVLVGDKKRFKEIEALGIFDIQEIDKNTLF